MEELWKNLSIKHFEDYQVSNLGNIKSPKGRIIKPNILNGVCVFSSKRTNNGKIFARINKSIAHLVYEEFNNIKLNRYTFILHKDKNNLNNSLDNLKIQIHEKPSNENVEYYIKYANGFVYDFLKRDGFLDKRKIGVDIENVVGNSLMYIYKYLYHWTPQIAKNPITSFYGFCKKYTLMAIKNEWKHFKNERLCVVINKVR